MEKKKPVINCHTHIFTGDHVPPFLAKTFVPSPLHYLFPLSLIVKLFRFWYNYPYTWQFKPWYKKIKEILYRINMFGARTGSGRLISSVIGLFLTIQVFYILFDWFSLIGKPNAGTVESITDLRTWLDEHWLLFIPHSFVGKALFILALILFFKPGRNILLLLLKKVWSFLGVLPGPQTKELAKRYLNIGRFAFYKEQTRVFGRLKNQYPDGTGFVVLPMDMEYMGAGKLKKEYRYANQMAALKAIKNNPQNKDVIFPFVFAEPRRFVDEGKAHFDYEISNGSVKLNDCFIKEYIEDNKFSGFKIYPALGYYPFDEALLPLWKYAADNGLPILTHCIRGTIYYRGNKKRAWDKHPVFEQVSGDGEYDSLLLMEINNRDFINNFTHPLNYLCLLDERLLRKLVQKAKSDRISELFGYTDDQTPLKYNLKHLKLCFGHFGGDDEWHKFLEADRDNYASQLVRNPTHGISFLEDEEGNPSRGKPEQIWKYVDWYSIICSMMLQSPNVYADLSYIIHSSDIQPLLKQTLFNDKLKERVLFGTDFYVVRNHKSEKNMLIDVTDHLSEQEFDQIARTNPRTFLSTVIHGKI
ncbi:MAG: hypothetical protein V4604_04805 [Bacteroidota bacterium]